MSETSGYVDYIEYDEEPVVDNVQEEAQKELISFFEKHAEEIFYVGQIGVLFEDKYFHWVTNRALTYLEERGIIVSETRPLIGGSTIKLLWYHRNRYYKRRASKILRLVREFSDPNIGAAIGIHGESMILEGFARCQFLMYGKEVKQYNDKIWKKTDHDLDFIFVKDEIGYGVEVKNKLAYIDKKEFKLKITMCKTLGIRPLFVVRMLPKSWIKELVDQDGFALIVKYQLYPPYLKKLAKKIKSELGLPVDTPRALFEGTMKRVLDWHKKCVKVKKNSQKNPKK